MYAAISADVVSSTSLSRESMIELNEKLRKCLYILEERYQGFWGRIVRGDSIECIMDRPEDAFEVASCCYLLLCLNMRLLVSSLPQSPYFGLMKHHLAVKNPSMC